MQKATLTYLFTFIALIGAFSFAQSLALANGVGETNYQGAMKTIPYATIEFKQGSAMLSDGDRTKIHDLVSDAADNGKIAKIAVAAWSDKSFPRERKLSDADRELADMRADNLRKCLRTELKSVDVNTYSMAEDTNWLARMFKTDDSELKSIFAKKGASAPVTHAEFRVIKNEGGPSSAVIVIEY